MKGGLLRNVYIVRLLLCYLEGVNTQGDRFVSVSKKVKPGGKNKGKKGIGMTHAQDLN